MKSTRMMAMLMGLFVVMLSQNALAFYNSATGRWLSRDPINERGFKVLARHFATLDLSEEKNLYVCVQNDALSNYDLLGLFGCSKRPKKPCCIVRWWAKKATPWGVFGGSCVYTGNFVKFTPNGPKPCCPAAGTYNPEPTVYSFYTSDPCYRDQDLPAGLSINMYQATDPPDGGWSNM